MVFQIYFIIPWNDFILRYGPIEYFIGGLVEGEDYIYRSSQLQEAA